MNSQAFKQLSREDKFRYVWTHCHFLASRFQHIQNRKLRINLFFSGHFFVEVWYNSPHDYFGDIKAFDDRKLLEPYIDTIDLDELMVL
jgi:hypothetical protein